MSEVLLPPLALSGASDVPQVVSNLRQLQLYLDRCWDELRRVISDELVEGPTSATDGEAVLFDGATGRLIKAAGGSVLRYSSQALTLLNDEATIVPLNGDPPTLFKLELTAESGGVDNFNSISGGSVGDLALVKAAASQTITVQHNTGSGATFFRLAGGAGMVIATQLPRILLEKDSSSRWVEVARSANL